MLRGTFLLRSAVKAPLLRWLFLALSVLLVLPIVWHSSPVSAFAEDHNEIFVTRLDDESMVDAIARTSINNPDYQSSAVDILEEWSSSLESGNDVSFGENHQNLSIAQKSAEVESALSVVQGVSETYNPTPTSTLQTVQPYASGLDPNAFKVNGWASSSGYAWSNLTLIVHGAYCRPSGCDDDTDKITCRLTVDPGAISSRISWNCGYFPNAGNFGDKHLENWMINRGDVLQEPVDSGNLFTGSGGSNDYVIFLDRAVNGSVITAAFALWVYVEPMGQYVYHGGKTADAKCNIQDNACLYSH